MEHGTSSRKHERASTAASSRHHDVIATVSGPPEHQTATTENTIAPSAKRAASGGLFSRWISTKTSDVNEGEEQPQEQGDIPRSKVSIDDEGAPDVRTSTVSALGLPGSAVRPSSMKQRKRTGSLRKSAILGGKLFGPDGRERRNSLLGRVSRTAQAVSIASDADKQESGTAARTSTTASHDQVDTADTAASRSTSAITEARLSLLTTQQAAAQTAPGIAALSSPSDPKSAGSYTSTTEDDEDMLSFSRPPKPSDTSIGTEPNYTSPLGAASGSYFPPSTPQLRSRSSHLSRPSPLQHAFAPAPEPYSYIETEYWGWVILFVTWLLFTVGMGSALDVWSWAWDVGQTPYAPPELEDDPTLPIVGYYPALIVLSGVVAWVWITVAWVGMKYFRHARIEV